MTEAEKYLAKIGVYEEDHFSEHGDVTWTSKLMEAYAAEKVREKLTYLIESAGMYSDWSARSMIVRQMQEELSETPATSQPDAKQCKCPQDDRIGATAAWACHVCGGWQEDCVHCVSIPTAKDFKASEKCSNHTVSVQTSGSNSADAPRGLGEYQPGDRVRIWLEDTQEPEGGYWNHCTLHPGSLLVLQDGFDYGKSGDKPMSIEEFDGYKIERIEK